ncbi:hypothetical protein ALI44B_00190 [Leifsonia sp. ALI-44-B]|uniref:GNAT family N-acetyltransferase n=1 Tax=Leifsonia sp. ALI-44-B TaxID=1933776 RepID=UPI00097C8EA7|nr:GNAT family N-acetyltransferase [Leifsonia sp. ALI-44-B]ONI65412.1 hypothetical protein ALI44B_00190 [Leifsonia sp. ALI-44-B]
MGREFIARVKVDGRRFTITSEREYPGHLIAFVHPRRRHDRGRLGRLIHGASADDDLTEMRFKITDSPTGRHGLVTNIAVAHRKRHQGWATSLVRVLLQRYPGVVWTVENPNEKSGQLFVKLANQHPGRVLPPVVNTRYAGDDPRRYGTFLRP